MAIATTNVVNGNTILTALKESPPRFVPLYCPKMLEVMLVTNSESTMLYNDCTNMENIAGKLISISSLPMLRFRILSDCKETSLNLGYLF